MTIGKAIERLIRNYDLAIQMKEVRDPVAWALYHTWDEADTDRKKREKYRVKED